MAEKRPQAHIEEDSSPHKRTCIGRGGDEDIEQRHDEQESPPDVPKTGAQPVEDQVFVGPASCGSTASSSGSSDSSSSDAQGDGDSSSGDSLPESLDMGLGDVQPELLSGPMGWLQQQMLNGVDPRRILMRIIPHNMIIPEDTSVFEMWSAIAEYLRSFEEPPPRPKLEQYNTFQDAIQLLQSCKNILLLTGAGVSVSCGIPDFRSRDGVYARLAVDFPDLPNPQAMFAINYFQKDPRPFFKFAKELFPGQFKPSTSHQFISQLERHQKLLRNYTQNIDTLEQAAGITRVVQCHGSFATATCTRCGHKVDSEVIREDVFNQVVPICPLCGPDTEEMAILKPDIVFFGEGLPKDFYEKLDDDKDEADLLIVIGSSLKVKPVATIPSLLPKNVPQILINREPLPHMTFDIELLGDCDVIINELLHCLGKGWDHVCHSEQRLKETQDMPDMPSKAGRPEEEAPPQKDDRLSPPQEQTALPSSVETGHSNDCEREDTSSSTDSGRVPEVEKLPKGEVELSRNEHKNIPAGSTECENSHSEMESDQTGVEMAEEHRGEVQSVKDDQVSPEDGSGPSASTSEGPKRESIATYLKASSYLFIPPCRYVFHGAEVYMPSDDSDVGDDDLHNAVESDLHKDLFDDDLHDACRNVFRSDSESEPLHSDENNLSNSSGNDLHMRENGFDISDKNMQSNGESVFQGPFENGSPSNSPDRPTPPRVTENSSCSDTLFHEENA
ncbi:NAD-dependent protein deacetylase sirtuin-1-like [Diadema setosum]|uniref:NAD-dependent protein deacetylase sirtuin-1-like n=1 Tax=Diadema setosum TaxID=31175 RepID=UPI003B3BC320